MDHRSLIAAAQKTLQDHTPPQNLEMEQALLGAILDDPAIGISLEGLVHPSDFYRDAHRLVFQALMDLCKRSGAVDLLTVQSRLMEMDALEKVGGAPYLVQLHESGLSSNWRHYATEVLRAAALRAITDACLLTLTDAMRREADVLELLNRLHALETSSVVTRLMAAQGAGAGIISASEVPAGETVPSLWFGMYQGAVTLLVGETGTGKSSLLYNIAIHLALGKPYLGFGTERQPMPVLYLDPENAGNWSEGFGGVCGMRLDRIGMGRPETLYFHSAENINLSEPSHVVLLERIIRQKQIEMVILDPIANLFRTTDENSNAEAARQMRSLTALSRATRACVVACHHTGKDPTGNYGRGASARLAAADVGLVLRTRSALSSAVPRAVAGERNDELILSIAKNRLGTYGSLSLRMAGNDRFELSEEPAGDWAAGAYRPTRLGEAADAVRELLSDGRPHSRKELAELLSRYYSRSRAEKLLARLREKGIIEAGPGPGKSLVYTLPRADAALSLDLDATPDPADAMGTLEEEEDPFAWTPPED